MGCGTSVTVDHSVHLKATSAKVAEVLERVKEENAARVRQQALLRRAKDQQREEAEHVFNSINNTHHHNINSKNYHYSNENFIAALDRGAACRGGVGRSSDGSMNGLPQFAPNGKSFMLYGTHQADHHSPLGNGDESSSFGVGIGKVAPLHPIASLQSGEIVLVGQNGRERGGGVSGTHFASASAGGSPTSQAEYGKTKSMPKNNSRSHNHFNFISANNPNCVSDESLIASHARVRDQHSLGVESRSGETLGGGAFGDRQVSAEAEEPHVHAASATVHGISPPPPPTDAADEGGTSMASIALKLPGTADDSPIDNDVEKPIGELLRPPVHPSAASKGSSIHPMPPHPLATSTLLGGSHSPDCGSPRSHTTIRHNSINDSNFPSENINMPRLLQGLTQTSEISNSNNPTVSDCQPDGVGAVLGAVNYTKAASSPTIIDFERNISASDNKKALPSTMY